MANTQKSRKIGYVVLSILYVLLMGWIAWSMISTRNWAEKQYASPQADEQKNWNDFRNAVTQSQQSYSPVKRKTPKSEEPPTAVLFREYFWTLMAGAIIFPSILYWATGMMFLGALLSPNHIPIEAEE